MPSIRSKIAIPQGMLGWEWRVLTVQIRKAQGSKKILPFQTVYH
jgi:hypothetical protein